MKSDSLLSILNALSTISKENRESAAIKILRNNLVEKLVFFLGAKEEKLSLKSAWVLEWICKTHHISYILPYLDEFCANLSKVHNKSILRSCAKICEVLTIYNNQKTESSTYTITDKNKQQLIEVCFDWLLEDTPIAVQIYAMTALYELGKDKTWVHLELKSIIMRKLIHQSSAMEARSKRILALI